MRQNQYQVAYVLPNSFKSALLPWWAKIPVRVGYSGELRSCLLTRAFVKPQKNNKPPMVKWYTGLANCPEREVLQPKLTVNPAVVDALLQQFKLAKPFLALAPGAEFGSAKQWPAEHFSAVAEQFLKQVDGAQVVVLGSVKDIQIAQVIEQKVPQALRQRVMVLAGKTTLNEAIGLLAGAHALVTNDSGLMHVGAALNIQVHRVFGSSSPLHTPPLSAQAQVYSLNLPCSPCFQRQCPLGHTKCLVDLSPDRIVNNLNYTNLN